LTVDHQRRDARDAALGGPAFVGPNMFGVVVTAEQGMYVGWVQPGFVAQPFEGLRLGDVETLGVVGVEQALHHRAGETVVGGEVTQPVGVERVHRPRTVQV
jgi:hypothetical protein